jgi:hypothetical protein
MRNKLRKYEISNVDEKETKKASVMKRPASSTNRNSKK